MAIPRFSSSAEARQSVLASPERSTRSQKALQRVLPRSLALLCGVLGVLGWSPDALAQVPEPDRELAYAQQGSHVTLDPIAAEDLDSWNLIGLMLRGLVRVDDNLQLGPDLATYTLHPMDDRIRVTFKLRSASWAGADLGGSQPVTARDVVHTLHNARGKVAKSTASPQVTDLMSDIIKWTADGDRTVHIDFKKSTWRPDTLGRLINLRLISQAQAVKRRKQRIKSTGMPWSTGAYIVHSKTEGTVRLSRRRDLTGNRPAIHAIQRSHRNDLRAVKDDLVIGNTDLMMDLSPKDADDIASRAESKAVLEATPSLSYTFIGINHQNDVLADRRMRQALSMMVDKRALIRSVFDRMTEAAIQVTGAYDPHLAGTYDPELELSWAHAPSRARAVLDEVCGPAASGAEARQCKGRPLSLRLLFNGEVERSRRIAFALEKIFESYGVAIEPVGVRARQLARSLTRRSRRQAPSFDLVLVTHALSLNFDPYKDWHSKGLSNYWGYSNSRVDRLLERQRNTDAQLRQDIFSELHEVMYDDQTALFLWSRRRFIAVNRRFTRVDPKRLDFFASLVEWGIDMRRLLVK